MEANYKNVIIIFFRIRIFLKLCLDFQCYFTDFCIFDKKFEVRNLKIPNMDENFLNNYQKTLFGGNNETAVAEAGIQRKCLAQMYSQSLATLDEQSICGLLEKNLHKYCEMLEKDVSVKTSPDENTIHYPVDLRSNLSQIDLGSLLKPFPCYESKDIASDFTNFRDCMFKSKTQVPIKQHREQKLTRSTSEDPPRTPFFKTARNELLVTQNHKKIGTNPQQRRTLGLRSNVNKPFVSPVLTNQDQKTEDIEMEVTDERLKNIDQKMIDLIKSEIMNIRLKIEWDDIAGLDFAKRAIREAVVLPMLRPDLFTGLRRPPKGILLFGPPGTGKTLIGKCVASQSKSTFFSISASSLTSKWVGEGEKMVRALFAVARCHQPAVIFIDEVDSLLSQRSETEHESSRRMKTEFLVQLEGATTDGEERLLVIGATNRPQELDEAARRRFVKRLYVPLPEFEARLQLLTRLIENERHNLDDDDFRKIAQLSDGYSGSDIRNLCAEASLGPIRSIDMSLIEKVQANEVRPLIMDDFHTAFTRIRSSVAPKDLEQYVIWDKTYGSGL